MTGSLLKSRYLQECRKYCPELGLTDLHPYPAGVRAQAVLPDGTLVHDFMFADTPRMVHVLNAPSPVSLRSERRVPLRWVRGWACGASTWPI